MKSKTLKLFIIFLIVVIVGAISLLLLTGHKEEPSMVLRIGYQPSTHHVAFLVAMEKGWWQERLKKFGVNEVKEYLFQTGPPEMSAMLAGEIDVAYVGVAPPITAIEEGLKAKIEASVQTNGSDLVVRKDFNYSGPASLKGAKIATFPSGSIQDTIIRKWLNQSGLDTEKDVTIYGMGPGEAVSALKANAVDAVFLPQPSPAIIESEGFGRSVEKSGKMWGGGHICCVLLISDKLINQNPSLAEEIIKIHNDATEYVKLHIDEASEIYSRKMNVDLNIVKISFASWDGDLIADPHWATNSTLDFAKSIYELNKERYTRPLNQNELFNYSLWDKIYPSKK